MRRDNLQSIVVKLDPMPIAAELEVLWRSLEARADASFFSSWSWIGCWLASLSPGTQTLMMTAEIEGEIVGLGIFVAGNARRLGILKVRLLALHSTGVADYDSLTVEHNDFLVDRETSQAVRVAMFSHLVKSGDSWDKLLLPGLSQSSRQGLHDCSGFKLRERTNPSFFIDLRPLAGREADYLGQLTSNTRQQIRRSMKAYREIGALELTEAADRMTAHRFLERLRTLHQFHWRAKGESGAFGNSYFVNFHRKLIDDCFERGHIQLLRFSVGEVDLGYLYNFVYRGRVFFYQSGFDYQLIQKHGRPGLVAHTMAVEHNARLGHHTYDLLAGSVRYKRSLASSSEPMSWVVLHRDTITFRAEELLRTGKRLLSRNLITRPRDGHSIDSAVEEGAA